MSKLKEQVETEIKRMDKNLKCDSLEFKAAGTLLASASLGMDTKRVSIAMDYPMEIVGMFHEAMKKNGIWKRGNLCVGWLDKESGGCSFWLDVCVLCGLMKRA